MLTILKMKKINRRMRDTCSFFRNFNPEILQGMRVKLSTYLILRQMKQRTTIKLIYAWALLLVFTSMLLLKDFHFHNTSYDCSGKALVSHDASVKQVCSTCDFTMHESTAVKTTAFQPVVAISWVPRLVFAEQTVYQVVVSLNSHSPPTVG